MNYSQLVSAIESYTENAFAVADINTFIEQAEQRIYNSAQPPILRKNVSGTTAANNKYLNLPLDFLAVHSLSVLTDPNAGQDSPQEYLLNKDVSFIREAYPNPTDTGTPKYYAVFGLSTGQNEPLPNKEITLILAPTPDLSYPVELHYFYYPESIVTAGTTWLGDNFDSVLLYGALLEAYTYMKGEQDVLNIYKARYDEAMALYKQLTDGKERRDSYRSGQIRVPVT